MIRKNGGSVIHRLLKRMIKIKRPSSGVKEGHFAVYAIEEGELKKFIVALVYLNHPEFLNLLKRAEEEFGFSHNGVLAVPCGPHELEKILERKDWVVKT